ncbi:uncharacterized protein LOC135493099 isoform X2 [Lineus longissimus]|uniref:uncharacterized protein LOC135493099 isoform X2 n=1 Tax=Lineus longissimus TaxID=88925 RepID=UPI00315D9BD3
MGKKGKVGTSIIFDKRAENHVKGYHPLGDVANSSIGAIKHLDLGSDECVTDAVLYKLARAPGWDFKKLETINLSGCRYVTDRGIKWLSEIMKKSDSIEQVQLDGLENVTENCFAHLADTATIRVKVTCTGSGVRFVKPYNKQLIIDSASAAIDEVFQQKAVPQNIGHVVVCPEQHTRFSLTAYIGQKKKEPLKPLFYHLGAGIAWTEISPTHPWFEKIIPDEPSVVVIPYDSSTAANTVEDHVFNIIRYFVGRSPPVHKTYSACRFIVVGIGGEHAPLKKADLSTSLGIKQLEDFIKEKERTLNDLIQLQQEQYAEAIKMVENLKAFTETKGMIEFMSVNIDGAGGLQEFIKTTADTLLADRQRRAHHYSFPADFESVFTTLSKQHGHAITMDKFDEEIEKVIQPGDIRRDKMLVKLFHNMGRCIYLDSDAESLVILNILWFFDLMNDLMTTKMTSCTNVIPCLTQDIEGLSEDEMKTLVKTCGSDYCLLMRLIWISGPVLTIPCWREVPSDIDKMVSVNLQNATKPPVPLEHYWQEGKEEKNLYTASNIFKLVCPPPGDLMSRVAALVSNVARFQILSSQGYVVHQGAVEVILYMKNMTEIILEARTISPPGKESMFEEKKDLRKYLWSVLNLHFDFLEFILKQIGAIYSIVRKGGDCGPWNFSICSHHTWEKPIVAAGETLKKMTVCTLCQNCSCDGIHCDHNGVPGGKYRECGCETDVTACWNCGICRRCAEIVWRVKSYLRPSQGDWKQMVLKDLRNPACKMFLTATDINVVFNELDIFTPTAVGPYVALIDVGGASNVQIFPGNVTTITKPVVDIDQNTLKPSAKWNKGDQLQVRLLTPKATVKDLDNTASDGLMTTLFNSHISRRVRIWQAEGILAYTPLTMSPPVGLYAGKLPLSPEHNYFEIGILDMGKKGTISLGIIPENYPNDQQIGWRDRSVGYHGDDGGVFLSSGYPQKKLVTWKAGDVIGCGVNFNDDGTKNLYFSHNGEKKYVLTGVDSLPKQVYPAVGFHSKYEKVRLLTESVWKAYGQVDMVKSAFRDPDTLYGEDVHISPRKKLMFEKASGWGDKRISCIFMKNVSKQFVVLKVVPKAKEYHIASFNPVIKPGEDRVVYIRSDCQDVNKDLTGDMFHVFYEVVSATLDEDDLANIADKLDTSRDGKKCHKLRFDWAGIDSAQSKLKPFEDEKPNGDSVILEVRKNGAVIHKYWVPKATYHVQLAFPQAISEALNKISMHMPRQPTFDLPDDFEPGMLLEYSPPGMDVFVAGIVKEVKQKGQLVIEPKYRPKDSDVEVVYTTLDSKSSAVRPIARPPHELPKLRGIEPTDLWDVAPPALFAPDQIKPNMVEHLWGFCIKRGTRCKTKSYLYTVQEKQLATLSLELLLSDSTDKLPDEMIPCTFLPQNLDATLVQNPNMTRLANFMELNVHPLCYPVGESHNLVAMTSPHILDSTGVQASVEPDLMFRELTTAWAFAVLGTRQPQLGAWSQLIQNSSTSLQNKHQVNWRLQQIFSIYAATVSILANHHNGIMELESSEAHQTVLEMLLKPVIIVDQDIKSGSWCDPKKIICVPAEPEYVCIGHFYARERELWPPHVKFKPELFTPYESDQHCIEFNLKSIEKLPEKFFTKFDNLEYLQLKNANSLEELPTDFGNFSKLRQLWMNDTTIKKFPVALNTDQLTRVHLCASKFTDIPESICDLPNLGILDMSDNPISRITPSIAKLKKTLKTLNISGIPWLSFQNSASILPPDWYKRENFTPAQKQNLKLISEMKLNKLFKDCDTDHNGMLDSKELPNMNAQMFFLVPRIGHDYEPGDADGGFPMEVLELEGLEDLYLENQAIHDVPPEIERLTKLRHLSLKYNPLLETIPGTIGGMKSVETINLRCCPSMKTPPGEIISRGIIAIKAYLKYLFGDETECHRTKLMLVGLGGAGKTSLLRALTCGEYKTKPTVGEDITDGIDIGSWTVSRSDDKHITFSTWDFAGQTIYYNTHQFFLSKRAVYLLLWTTRLGYEHAGLDFWLSSISCHAPDTPIFIVGTHCDQVAKSELPKQELMKQYKQIVGFHFVSSITGTGIRELQEELLESALGQQYMGERVPKIWMDLEKKVLDNRRNTSIMKWSDLQAHALEVGIFDEKDTKQAIQLLHDLGTVQYFDNDFLREHIVINPQWIVDVMSCIVSVKESPIRDGRFFHKDMKIIWKKEREDLHKWLLRLTERFDLTFPLVTEEKINVVPCLLPQQEPGIDWMDTSLPENDSIREMKIVYKFSYLPAGLFNRAQVRLFEFSDSSRIWKQGSLLSKNGHQALIRQTNDQELVVRVQGLRPQNIVFMIHEVFELLIKESFNGVQCDLFLPCPDCLNKEKTKNPALMKATLIRHAMELKAPYLQCRKYFHTISMPELQAIVPPDSTMDFDVQMEASILLLRDLRQEMATDVFMLYCSEDLAVNGGGPVCPTRLKADIEKEGYKVTFPNANTSVEDMTLGLKDCKMLIVCMSNAFEADYQLCDLFLYARDTLGKPFLVCGSGQNMNWQRGVTGGKMAFVVSDVVYINFTRIDNYEVKMKELKSKVKDKLDKAAAEKKFPQCFLSYCWANSNEAIKHGYRVEDDNTLGWVDPRDMKKKLEEAGISCWLDIEQAGAKGLFEDISDGIKYADVVVACVSREYKNSVNCMMELRFAVTTMNKPVIFASVGQGDEWEHGEIGMLIARKKHDLNDPNAMPKINFQEESKNSFSKLVTKLKAYLPDGIKPGLGGTMKVARGLPRAGLKSSVSNNNIVFQEEYELLQRKYLRQVTCFPTEGYYPRIFVLDFADEKKEEQKKCSDKFSIGPQCNADVSEVKECDGVVSEDRKKSARPKSSMKREKTLVNDSGALSNDWRDAKFCFRILCEHDQGWHECSTSIDYNVSSERKVMFINSVAPYLLRMYNILKHSGIMLNCLGGTKGEKYMSFIRESVSGDVHAELKASYIRCQNMVRRYDPERKMGNLERCLLPSGKILWLCKDHQEKKRVIVLNSDMSSGEMGEQVVFEEDHHLKEALVKYAHMTQPYRMNRPPNKKKLQTKNESDNEPNKGAWKTTQLSTPMKKKFKAAGVAAAVAGTYDHNHANGRVDMDKGSKTCTLM